MKLTDIIDEMQAVNKKTGKDITKHLIAYLEKKISKEEFEKLTGLKKDKIKVSEATNVWKIFDMKQRLYGDIMDIEMDMKTITKDLGQLHKDMEQEAEPSGGKVADKYGKQIDKLEKEYKNFGKFNLGSE